MFTFLLAVSEANESKSDDNYILILEYACLSVCEQKSPCFGVNLLYGFSLDYGVSPCHGVSPCYDTFAWVTRPERLKGKEDKGKRPEGPPALSQGPVE